MSSLIQKWISTAMATCWGMLCIIVLTAPACGQESISGTFHGSLREHVAFYSDDTEFQDNSSRIGFKLSYDRDSASLVYCHIEWSLKLVGSDVSFNADANGADDFGALADPSDEPVFEPRLGYFGLKRKWGWLTIGKQWSVYSQVARMADRLVVFGGEANGCYSAGTDGGSTGTGRADRSLAYYYTHHRLTFGFQGQMKGNTQWPVDGFGSMIKYQAGDGVAVGYSFNLTKIGNQLQTPIVGLDDDASVMAAGISFDQGPVSTSLVVSRQVNIGLASLDNISVVYDATGLEWYGAYNFPGKFAVHLGIVSLWPDDDYREYLAENFKTQYLAVGLNTDILQGARLYLETKFNNSYGPDGEKGVNVIAAGLTTNFSFAHNNPMD